MFNRLIVSLAIISLYLTGCATSQKMAFENNTDTHPTKPVYLMSVTLKNNYRTSYQPKLLTALVEKKDAKEDKDHLNFDMDAAGKSEADTPEAGNSYLLRMELENGEYVIRGLSGFSGTFPFHGTFFAPLHADTKSNGSGVFYLGHVSATVRERKENEFKAGVMVPLIDQAVTGFSGGTFDIEISDQLDKDQALFKSKFSALQNVTIQKSILASFDRAKAQQWWDAH